MEESLEESRLVKAFHTPRRFPRNSIAAFGGRRSDRIRIDWRINSPLITLMRRNGSALEECAEPHPPTPSPIVGKLAMPPISSGSFALLGSFAYRGRGGILQGILCRFWEIRRTRHQQQRPQQRPQQLQQHLKGNNNLRRSINNKYKCINQ